MPRKIALKYSAECRDCGASLAVGTLARYYGRGRVYGTECHEQKPQRIKTALRDKLTGNGISKEWFDSHVEVI